MSPSASQITYPQGRKMANGVKKSSSGSQLGPCQSEVIWFAGIDRDCSLERFKKKKNQHIWHMNPNRAWKEAVVGSWMIWPAELMPCHSHITGEEEEECCHIQERTLMGRAFVTECQWEIGADWGEDLLVPSSWPEKGLPSLAPSLTRCLLFSIQILQGLRRMGSNTHPLFPKVIQFLPFPIVLTQGYMLTIEVNKWLKYTNK